jgi:predicted restriction endonuclease
VRFILERVVSNGASVNGDMHGNLSQTTTSRFQTKPSTTERKGLVTSRVGQGYYRQEILRRFEGRCAVTGVNSEELLIASHIVPWRDSNEFERLDVNNGILLSPTYDALFDKHLISFEDDGHIVLSTNLPANLFASLGVSGIEKIKVFEGMKVYVLRHRENLR